MLQIFCDQNIPLAKEYFSSWAKITFFDGRKLQKSDLSNVDILLVRSVTKINANLLEGTSIKVVGSATAGINHVDQEFLKAQNIFFCHAPGSNSWSVADHILACISQFIIEKKLKFNAKIGVIAHGNVGSKVSSRLRSLGFEVVDYDPPLAQINTNFKSAPLNALFDCDLLSFHTPLTKSGDYPTENFLDETFFNSCKQGTIFCNTSRGEIVMEEALLKAHKSGQIAELVMDVFEDEPNINPYWLKNTNFCTPHIAGYSYTGKIRGTRMLAEQITEHLNINYTSPSTNEETPTLEWLATESIWEFILKGHDVQDDHNRLLEACSKVENANEVFDSLRKGYPKRFEFGDFKIKLSNAKNTSDNINLLHTIGFTQA
jgi:erythronate-4-phosphate dehydrogenase